MPPPQPDSKKDNDISSPMRTKPSSASFTQVIDTKSSNSGAKEASDVQPKFPAAYHDPCADIMVEKRQAAEGAVAPYLDSNSVRTNTAYHDPLDDILVEKRQAAGGAVAPYLDNSSDSTNTLGACENASSGSQQQQPKGDEDQRDSDALPMPSLHRSSHPRVRSSAALTPGAFSVEPSSDTPPETATIDDISESLSDDNSEVSHADCQEQACHHEDCDIRRGLPQATPVDLEASGAHGDNQGEHRQTAVTYDAPEAKRVRGGIITIVLMAILLLFLGLGLGLGLRFSSASASRSTGSSQDNNSSVTLTPVLNIEQYIQSLLPEETVTQITVNRNDDSTTRLPQTKALDWLIQDPNVEDYSAERLVQRFVLATLFYATNGDDWVHNQWWLSYEHDECDWYAWDLEDPKVDLNFYFPAHPASLHPCDAGDGIISDTYHHIWLSNNNVRGTLPTELSLLTNLQSIMAYSNRLEGTIPTQFALLTNLDSLSLYANALSGSLPTQLGMLPNLTGIFAFANPKLGGTVPSELASLTKLRFALLLACSFTGTLPTQLGLMTSLTYFIVDTNELTGTIPSELGMLGNAENFNLGGNELEGTLPSQLGLLSNVNWLHLSGNKLTGQIPSELGLLTSLVASWLQNNELTGTVPHEIGELYGQTGSLETLNLTRNQLSGTLSPTFCSAPRFSFDCSAQLCGCGCDC